MVTVTIPTKNRPQALVKCLRSIPGDVNVRIGCVDKSRDIPDGIVAELYREKREVTVTETDLPIIGVQNLLAHDVEGDVLPAADDFWFHRCAFVEAMEAMDRRFPDHDGIVGFDITNMRAKGQATDYALMLIGSKFFTHRLGRVAFWPKYLHFFADTELGEYARKIGKFYLCRTAWVEHYHPVLGYKADETHLFRRSEKWEHDHNLYKARSDAGVFV